MIKCKCPNCKIIFETNSNVFGHNYQCICDNEWILDIDNLVEYELPKSILIKANPGQKVNVEYNFPVLKIEADENGDIKLTDKLISKALSDYICCDGQMDHMGEVYTNQRYIIISSDSNQHSIDLSEGKKEIKIKV